MECLILQSSATEVRCERTEYIYAVECGRIVRVDAVGLVKFERLL